MRLLARSSHWELVVAALAFVLMLGAWGCDELTIGGSTLSTDGLEGTTSTGPALPSTEVPPTTTEPVVTTSTTAPLATSSEQRLANGRIKACGVIKDVWMDGNERKLTIDYVDFLVGADADAAALADGVIAPGEHVDNDYYVRNKSTKLREFTVSDSVVIITYSRQEPLDAADPQVPWEDFYDFWNLIGPPLPEDMGLFEGLWWIERDGETVVKIEQQWVP